ncbi:MAG: hypothetical protein H7Z74_16000 [Anaerolineae bacterium]|nr:hypothetical protein [Gemmatimonadaceae bacterium]
MDTLTLSALAPFSRHTWRLFSCFLVLGAVVATTPCFTSAQTDYYNTDAGRPIQIEDAYALERRGFEIELAPFRLERSRRGIYNLAIEPELSYGILPRTDIEIGLPFAFIDAGLGNRTAGLAGIDLSVFHNLNVETAIPALAVAASVLLPAGGLAADRAYASVKGIVTRTVFSSARIHLNGQYTFGDELPEVRENGSQARTQVGQQALELSRWLGGIAIDRTFPLRALLVTGEVYAQKPLREREDVELNTGVGLRYQLSPRLNVDGGIGRRLSGDDRGWYVTFGSAVAFGLPWRP